MKKYMYVIFTVVILLVLVLIFVTSYVKDNKYCTSHEDCVEIKLSDNLQDCVNKNTTNIVLEDTPVFVCRCIENRCTLEGAR